MANTKIPSELSSTPSISDGGNATAITITSDEYVGIGNANPNSFRLYVDSSSTGKGLFVDAQDSGYTAIGFSGDGTTAKGSLTTHNGMVYLGSENAAGTGSNGEISIEPSTSQRLKIDSAGRITMPSQPAFCVANPQGTYPVSGNFGKSDNPTAGSSYTLHVNQGSHFSTSTGRFTAPIAGKYYFSFSAMFDSNSGGDAGFDFKVNGTSAYGGEALDSGTDTYLQLAGSILLSLSANDYVELYIRASRIHQRYGSFEGFLLA